MTLHPGIHYDIPAAHYHAMTEAVSNSMLGEMNPPQRLQHYLTAPRTETAWGRIGTLVHHATNEPEKPWPAIAIEPETYFKGDEVKPWHNGAAYCKAWRSAQETQGRIVLSQKEWEMVHGCINGIRADKQAEALFKAGRGEVTAIAPLMVNGHTVLRRVRIDWVAGRRSALVDIKTTAGRATKAGFTREAINRGYFRQAAYYMDTWNAAAPHDRRDLFVWVVVEKEPPFCAVTFTIEHGDDCYRFGHEDYMAKLAVFAKCRAEGVWPGYSDLAVRLELPKWAREAWN